MISGRRLIAAVVLAVSVNAVVAEEGPSDASVSMAATLIGSISFIMLLTYFLNWKDEDIQASSYDVVSSTISIFCAVLLFSSFNDLAEAYIIEPFFGEDKKGAVIVDVVHMVVWFVILQVALANLSGAAGPFQVDAKKFEALPEGEKEEIMESKEINCKCYAILLAHITGFATINAFATIQNVYFNSAPHTAFAVVPVAFIVMYILQQITDRIREHIAHGDDGEEDEFEKLWDEETEEAENDVMGLVLSFCFINALRFAITGCLPNAEGKEEECGENYLFEHTNKERALLLGAGLVTAGLLFFVRMFWPEWAEAAKIEKMPVHNTEDKKKKITMLGRARVFEGLYAGIGMCFSWCMFFGGQMFLASFRNIFQGQDELMSVCLAMVISLIMMFGLIPLDKLADAEFTGPAADNAIRSLMAAMGILIGFSWEQCFDTSVDALSEKSNDERIRGVNQHSTKLFLSAFCAMLVVPAWKRYILPYIVNKGWRVGTVLKIDDLEKAAKALIEGYEEEEEATAEEREVFAAARTKRAARVEKALSAAMGGNAKELPTEQTAYQPLAGDETAALRMKNAELTAELQQCKVANVQARQMFDTTMDSMMKSMKQMHDTVTRLEQSN